MNKYNEMIGCISGSHPFVTEFVNSVKEAKKHETEWVASLRKKGFKAAHPNDGWVDMKNNRIHFCYPQFNDGVEVGSKVMLGSHYDKITRPVFLTRKESMLLDYYYFEDLKQE